MHSCAMEYISKNSIFELFLIFYEMSSTKKTNIIYNIFDLVLKPFKSESELNTSSKILRECIDYINNERLDNRRAVVMDRNAGKKDLEKRELFITSIAFSHPDGVWKGRMALLRNNRTPLVYNKDNFSISPLSELGEASIAETTHFIIDCKGDVPIFMFEFNSHGPRILDIEYYIRQITWKILKSSTACKANIRMKISINEVLSSLSDVLNFKIKANPKKLAYLNSEISESFIGNMQALANTVSPQAIRIEAFFRARNTKVDSKFKNIAAVKFVTGLLTSASKNSEILDEIEEFHLEFEKLDGSEDTINLLKGKVELEAESELEVGGNVKMKSLFETAIPVFKEYLNTSK